MLNFILDFIFPKFCLGCGKFNTYLCKDCYQKINFYPLAIQPIVEKSALKKIFVVAQYEGVTKKLITALKYKNIKNIAKTLAQISYYTADFPQVDAITSVPLHPKKYQLRGFNQATEIALNFSQLAQIPFMTLLKRVRNSSPQALVKNKNQRLIRLKNTFTLSSEAIHLPKTVLIIDDVTTTGTTLNECALILKQAGVEKIYGLVIAHGS